MARKLESVLIDGPAGKIEGLLEEPEHGQPQGTALICHPHPLYGGTMHNKVVHRLARGLRRAGAVVLRFNFRGVGRSEGIHDHGRGERADAAACLEWLKLRYPDLPYTLAGFSFGARVAMRLGCELMTASRRVIAAGFPTRLGIPERFMECTATKVFIQSTHDEHGPRDELQRLFDSLRKPKDLIWIEASDHFFKGSLDAFEEAVFRVGSGGNGDF